MQHDVLGSCMLITNNLNKKDADYQIASFIIEHFTDIHDISLQDIAQSCYTSISAVKNFFRLYGIQNYSLTKNRMMIEQKSRMEQIERNFESADIQKIQKAMFTISTCETMDLFLQMDKLQQIIEKLHACKRIVIYASTNFIHLLDNFQIDMTMMGRGVLMSPIVHHQMVDLKEEDVVFLVSGTGRSLFDEYFVDKFCDKKNPIIVVSGDNECRYPFLISDKISTWAENEMFDAEYLTLFYFDMLRKMYYTTYKER